MIFTDVNITTIKNLLKNFNRSMGYAHVGWVDYSGVESYKGGLAIRIERDETEPHGVYIQSSIPIMLNCWKIEGFEFKQGDVFSEGPDVHDGVVEDVYPYFAFELEDLYDIK